MDIFVKNASFEIVYVIDRYESFIWTDRYQTTGDFEIYMPYDSEVLSNVQVGYYLQCLLSEHTMILENISIDTEAEGGIHMTLSGRSAESILDRRIIWGDKTISGALNTCVHTLLNECIISPSDNDRKISNFSYKETTDTTITGTTVEAQFYGDVLLDVIESLCSECDCGYKVILNSSNNFEFSLYCGADRSYSQSANTYVVFSPSFDNLVSSNYYQSIANYKNVTLVGGEGEGTSKTTAVYPASGASTGLDRREIYTDAGSLSTNSGEVSASDYAEQLRTAGKENLNDYKETATFEGESDYNRSFTYNSDYFVGDIVQYADVFGMTSKVRVAESIISDDTNGFMMYPSFETIEEEEDDN